MSLKSILQFIKYWYFRYLMVTEMYMVEPWERFTMHVLFAVFFGMFWMFNYSIVMSGISQLRGWDTEIKRSEY